VELRFKSLAVHHRVQGGTMIVWNLVQPAPSGVTFVVNYSDSGVDDWEHVATVVDGGAAFDVLARHRGVAIRGVYRVTATAGTDTAVAAASVDEAWDAHNRLIARAIIRKEYMLLSKRTGTPGRLWKRRHWGQACTCVDPDTGEPRDSHCLKCFGTGISGGYLPAVDYIVALGPARGREIQTSDPGDGTVDPVTPHSGRSLICPRLDAGDVWAPCASDERYVVGQLRETYLAGQPLLYEAVELKPAPAADVLNKLPSEGAPGGEGGGVMLDGGRFLVYDVEFAGYYPTGIFNGNLTVFNMPTVSYQVSAGGQLMLWDMVAGEYRHVGLDDGVFQVYPDLYTAPDATARIDSGRLLLWDRSLESYWRCGLDGGAFTVFEEVAV
jgi:hypothetical protein